MRRLTVGDELDEQEDASSDDEEGRQERPSWKFLQQPNGDNVGRDLSDSGQEAVHEGIPAQVRRVQG